MSLKNGQKNTRLKVEDKKVFVKTEQDVQPVLDYTKAKRSVAPGKFEAMGDFVHVARIPHVVAREWMNQGVDLYDPDDGDVNAIKTLLNTHYKNLKVVDRKL